MSHTIQHAADTISGPPEMALAVLQILFLAACLYVIAMWLISGGFNTP